MDNEGRESPVSRETDASAVSGTNVNPLAGVDLSVNVTPGSLDLTVDLLGQSISKRIQGLGMDDMLGVGNALACYADEEDAKDEVLKALEKEIRECRLLREICIERLAQEQRILDELKTKERELSKIKGMFSETLVIADYHIIPEMMDNFARNIDARAEEKEAEARERRVKAEKYRHLEEFTHELVRDIKRHKA